MGEDVTPRYETDAQQHLPEHDAFLKILKRENVSSYLEIGSKYGGSLWRVANALPKGSRIAAIDMPLNDEGRISFVACMQALHLLGYGARWHCGASGSMDAVLFAEADAPYDCVFIDANHALPFVTKDWEHYGRLAKIVAFHDINHTKAIKPGRNPIDCAKFWKSIKGDYRHEEIKLCHDTNGIGVLWRT